MTVRMLSIETVVPETVIRQEDVTRLFAERTSREPRRVIPGCPANSRVTSPCRMTVSGTTVSIDSMRTVMPHGRHRSGPAA